MRLSLCIATLNRAGYIGATLDAILPQLTPDVEVVVVDGASTDQTPEVMAAYCGRHPNVVYRREPGNSGVDADFDKAVNYARGDYCWLMSDDDLVVPGAIARVLDQLADAPQALIVNAEIRDRELVGLLKPRQWEGTQDRRYDASGHESFFAEAGSYLSFIGGVVVERRWWLARDRAPFYGSLFIHVGVLFQQPAPSLVKVLAEPLVRIRYGNALWTARAFDIWMFKWPSLVWSFEHFSEAARQRVSPRRPGASLKTLLWYRGLGAWGAAQLRGATALHALAPVVARLPVRLLNAALAAYCGASRHGDSAMKLYDLAQGSGSSALARRLARRSRFPETGR
jgi:abequosyltransferase